MENEEMVMEMSWKSHGQMFWQVCGNPALCSGVMPCLKDATFIKRRSSG